MIETLDVNKFAIFGAILVVIGEGAAVLLAVNFCVRPAPRPHRVVRGIALVLLAASAISVRAQQLPMYFVAFAWVILGVTCLPIAWVNYRAAIDEYGDRCPD